MILMQRYTITLFLFSIVLGVMLPAQAVEQEPVAAKGLFIVAPRAFHPALEDYVVHKQKQLPTKLVALEHVLGDSPGADDPERVKRLLFQAWNEERLGYALLVGDADVFPVRYMVLDRTTAPAFDYAFYPSDLYYSDLAHSDGTFDDWNAQKEGFHATYYGEVRGETNKGNAINFDDIDYRPDCAVGRWPVNSLEEVKTIAAKTIAYETALQSGDKPGKHTAALLAVGGWVDTRAAMDRMAGQLPAGWNTQKRYFGSRSGGSKETPPSEKDLIALLNEGLGLALHTGHGQDDQWEQCFSVKSLSGVRNADRLPVMISAGCSTARLATLPPYEAYVDAQGKEHAGTNLGEVFKSPPPPPAPYQKGKHNPTGLGEQLLRGGPHGAVAYIGCNTGSQPCGVTLLEGFTKTLNANPKSRLGDCWSGAVAHYYEREQLAKLKPTSDWYPPSVFFQAMKFMCYGDPSLMMAGE